MVDFNITVKVRGLEKLLDVIASGIGAVAGPMLAPWIAKRHAEAKHIEAKGQANSLRTIAQAQADARQAVTGSTATTGSLEITQNQITQRLQFQEHKRQQNIVAVVRQAAEELADEEVPDHEPDHDWTARFFEYVQDVSEEDVRRIWGRILAGQVKSPGGVSLRTLSILRNMSHLEAELFREAMRYCIEDYVFYRLCSELSDNLNSNDFYFRFVDMGLFYSPIETRPPRHISLDEKGAAYLVNADHILFLHGTPRKTVDHEDDKAVLKTPAIELAPFCKATSDSVYLRHFATRLAKKQCTLMATPIEEITPDGYRFSHEKASTVEPI